MYYTIPPHERHGGKLGEARALKGHFVGYSYSKFLQPCYRVVAKYANGIYGRVHITKDVIFDMNINFWSELESDLPNEVEFNSIPSLELVADEDNADALRRQLILAPAIQDEPVPDIPPAPVIPPDSDHLIHHEDDIDIIPDIDHGPYLPEEPDKYNDSDIGDKFDIDGNIQYWYNLALNDRTKINQGQIDQAEFNFRVLEKTHWEFIKRLCFMMIKDPRILKSYEEAMTILEWHKAIETELEKFRTHNCLIMAIYDGQYLVPMKWIFSIKTDGTDKARLLGRGGLMTPWIDFNPKEIYCSNISACSIKLVLTIAAFYELRMRGGDLVDAYLVTQA